MRKISIKTMKKKENKGLFKWLPDHLVFVDEAGYGKWESALSKEMVSFNTVQN